MLKVAAINVVALAAIALVAELIFGFWLWGDPLQGLNVFRSVTWRYDVDHLYLREEPVVYRRDEWGLRGSYGKPADIDVLVVGGSTTDERFVSEGETWTEVLAQCLKDNGRPLAVANAGVTGQSAKGVVSNFDLWFPKIPGLKPRYLLAYLGINDIWAMGKINRHMDDPRLINEQATVASDASVLVQRLKMNSAFYRLYRTIKGTWIVWRAGIAHRIWGMDDGANDPRSAGAFPLDATKSTLIDTPAFAAFQSEALKGQAESLEYYRKNLNRLREIAGSKKMQLVFVTQRWATYEVVGNAVVGNARNYVVQEAFNAVTREVCKTSNDVHCIDLAADFSFQARDVYDVIHTTPQGSRRVGEYICSRFVKLPH